MPPRPPFGFGLAQFVSAVGSGKPDARLPEQRIDGALQLADHRADPPALNQPLPHARLPDAPCPASAHRIGADTAPSPSPRRASRTLMLGGTLTSV